MGSCCVIGHRGIPPPLPVHDDSARINRVGASMHHIYVCMNAEITDCVVKKQNSISIWFTSTILLLFCALPQVRHSFDQIFSLSHSDFSSSASARGAILRLEIIQSQLAQFCSRH